MPLPTLPCSSSEIKQLMMLKAELYHKAALSLMAWSSLDLE